MKMSVIETLTYTNIGGVLGTIVFLYFSDFLIRIWNKTWPEGFVLLKKKRKVFTTANRRFVRIKIKYGLPGIVILSPVLLSIPLGSFLAAKYYGTKPRVLLWLIAGQMLWSVIYTFFYTQVKTVIL
jgi:hypothetical protein